ncbi:MAG TPA: flagellar biosynthetic protein FliR [Candidatus Dormibacteraeota bacterium]|nr:flagellar biosynthetic protein FliR [Candidatus Dormibacteraeota bacterium]
MVDLFGLSGAQFETFLLVFIRISTMLFVFPAISSPQVPMQVRLGLSALLAFILYRSVPLVTLAPGISELVFAVVCQVVLGLLVGFVSSFVFIGIQFAGELIDLQIGFAVANVINPTTQQQVTIIGEFELAIATLLFFVTNAHYYLIQGVAGSFNLVPLPYIHLDPSVAGNVMIFFSAAFTSAFKIAAPVAVALFVTNIAFAFMSRVAPQMNVFVVGFPIQVGVGLIMLAVTMPLLGNVAPDLFANVAYQMDVVMRGLRVH